MELFDPSLYHGIDGCYSLHVIPTLFAVATLASQNPSSRPLVLIPAHESEAECVVHERLAAVLDLIPDVRVVRATKQKGEKLEAARIRLHADLALARENANLAATGRSTKTQPLGIDTFAALTAVWPPGFPLLPSAHALAAANHDALMAACRNDAPAAYGASGPAIGPMLRNNLDPPVSPNPRVLERWAQGKAAARKKDHKRAIILLKGAVESFARGSVGPVWRRPAANQAATKLSLYGDLLVAFEAGTFVAMDVTSGEERWHTTLGTAEPELVEADRFLLALLESKIVALDPKNGKSAWWVELVSPYPEIVVRSGRIFAAGVEEMIAIDAVSGAIAWRFDPLEDIAAGPVAVGNDLALAASTFVLLVGSTDGKEKRKSDAKDEISSPLIVTPKGSIWALVGSDEVVQIDPDRGEVKKRANRFPGADWPPAVAGERLLLAARRGKKTLVAYFDPDAKNNPLHLYYGSRAPLVRLPDDRGVVHPSDNPFGIVARAFDGKTTWMAKQNRPITSLSSIDGFITAAIGTRVIVLDQAHGHTRRMVELDGRIREAILGTSGGAAVLEKGPIYGLPGQNDPRPLRWLEEARMDLARSYVELKQRAPALAVLKAILTSNPKQLDALALRAETNAAPADWLELSSLAPRGDPLAAQATEELSRLAGIDPPLSLEHPIESLAISGDTILLLADGAASARSASQLLTVSWSKSAKAISAAPGGFEIDGTFFDPQGRAGQKHQKEHRLFDDGLFAVEAGGTISRLDSSGKPKWRQTFDHDADVLAASARAVLIGDTSGGIQVLDAATGAHQWSFQLPTNAARGWIGNETVLAQTEKGFVILALEDGKKRSEMKSDPKETPVVSVAFDGYSIIAGRKLTLVDEKGKQRPLVFPSRIVGSAGSFVALEDGTLCAFNEEKAQVGTRLPIGPFKKMASANGRLFALRTDGVLLSIDADRALKPAK